jgi:hypothetical protein
MTALSPLSIHVTDQVLAVLAAEYPVPAPTRLVEDRTGYGPRYGLLTYRMLTRLARRGEAEKITVPNSKSRYWRLTAPPQRQVSTARATPSDAVFAGMNTKGAWGEFLRAFAPWSDQFGELQPCGTTAAYQRHMRRGEDACPSCDAAVKLARDERRAAS